MFAVEEVVGEFIIFGPQGKCLASGFPRAGRGAVQQAGHRCQWSFHQLNDLADGILLRLSDKPVTAALAAGTNEKSAGNDVFYDDFQRLR